MTNKQPVFITEDEPCPVCRTNKYLNPNLKLLVSSCMHTMCENCVDRIFANGASSCPICKSILKKSNFVKPKFEDLLVEKECGIRKRVWRIFNKRQEDFESLQEYNDYLEQVEEIIFDLVNDVNISSVEERIEKYRNENADLIQQNIQKEMDEHQMLNQLLETQALDFKETQMEDFERRRKEQEQKFKYKKMMIQQIASSKKNASAIMPVLMEEFLGHSESNPASSIVLGKRGIDIQEHLIISQKRIREAANYPNPFENVLETPFDRSLDTPSTDFSKIADPSLASGFTTDLLDSFRAGGFRQDFVFKRAIQSIAFAVFVAPAE